MSDSFSFDLNAPYVRWWLAMTSPQISYGRHSYDYERLGMTRDQGIEASELWRQELVEIWGIEHRFEWLEMIFRLAEARVHGQTWRSEFGRRACLTSSEWQQRVSEVAGVVAQAEMRFLDTTYRQVGVVGFQAWDYCRATFLVRAGYELEVFSQSELAYLLNFIGQRVQAHFHSWEHYIKSFILGRTYWQYSVQDDPEKSISGLLNDGLYQAVSEFFYNLKQDKEALIFAIDWQTPLPSLMMPDSLDRDLETMLEM